MIAAVSSFSLSVAAGADAAKSAVRRARAMRIHPRKPKPAAERRAKRAAIVLRRGMKVREFRRMEAHLAAHDIVGVPVITAHGPRALPEAPAVCGLVVPGVEGVANRREEEAIAEAVRASMARDIPVLALSNSIDLAFSVAGLAPPEEAHPAALLTDAPRMLASEAAIQEAVKLMARTPHR